MSIYVSEKRWTCAKKSTKKMILYDKKFVCHINSKKVLVKCPKSSSSSSLRWIKFCVCVHGEEEDTCLWDMYLFYQQGNPPPKKKTKKTRKKNLSFFLCGCYCDVWILKKNIHFSVSQKKTKKPRGFLCCWDLRLVGTWEASGWKP